MDFSDLPVLGAHDSGEAETRAHILETIGSYTRGFFDKYLKGMNAPLLDGKITGEFVQAVERFDPASVRATAR